MYSFDDLTAAMADLNYAKKAKKEWSDLAKSARSALESHEREEAKAQLEVDRLQLVVDKVLNGMGR